MFFFTGKRMWAANPICARGDMVALCGQLLNGAHSLHAFFTFCLALHFYYTWKQLWAPAAYRSLRSILNGF